MLFKEQAHPTCAPEINVHVIYFVFAWISGLLYMELTVELKLQVFIAFTECSQCYPEQLLKLLWSPCQIHMLG